MSDQDGPDSFVDKWRARWPEWAVAQVFVPAEQREIAMAWSSLLQELTDAAWGGTDPRPGEAKLGWWLEELQGWSKGLRRHPLGQVLQRQPAPWATLAAALPGLLASRERPLDAADAGNQLRQLAESVAAIEQVLVPASPGTWDEADSQQAVLTSLMHARQAFHPEQAAPLQAMAADPQQAATQWENELAGRERPGRGVPRHRQILAALALARLARGQAGRPLGLLTALWISWRAARG